MCNPISNHSFRLIDNINPNLILSYTITGSIYFKTSGSISRFGHAKSVGYVFINVYFLKFFVCFLYFISTERLLTRFCLSSKTFFCSVIFFLVFFITRSTHRRGRATILQQLLILINNFYNNDERLVDFLFYKSCTHKIIVIHGVVFE